ncbi:MAG: hypothetical protein DI542_17675 [Acinetobacter johnsonii]|uniref:Uncharacterized protein n=1 Tax=Acinetobacter johnsonii TaxID=40214 RepID=A0A2W5R3H1_ACIJO|nr:MAG: hypothetical protein DI542_17675 [Acinetobacter johnsonii]
MIVVRLWPERSAAAFGVNLGMVKPWSDLDTHARFYLCIYPAPDPPSKAEAGPKQDICAGITLARMEPKGGRNLQAASEGGRKCDLSSSPPCGALESPCFQASGPLGV